MSEPLSQKELLEQISNVSVKELLAGMPEGANIALESDDILDLRLGDIFPNVIGVDVVAPEPEEPIRFGDVLGSMPQEWFTDPVPPDIGNLPLPDIWPCIPGGGVTDPAPEDIANRSLWDLFNDCPDSPMGEQELPELFADISLEEFLARLPLSGEILTRPEDIPNLSEDQLEFQLHNANAELIRVSSLRHMISSHLNELIRGE